MRDVAWLAPKEVAALAPEWGYAMTLRLAAAGWLESKRPTKGRILVSRASVLRLRSEVAADPDFWRRHRVRA